MKRSSADTSNATSSGWDKSGQGADFSHPLEEVLLYGRLSGSERNCSREPPGRRVLQYSSKGGVVLSGPWARESPGAGPQATASCRNSTKMGPSKTGISFGKTGSVEELQEEISITWFGVNGILDASTSLVISFSTASADFPYNPGQGQAIRNGVNRNSAIIGGRWCIEQAFLWRLTRGK